MTLNSNRPKIQKYRVAEIMGGEAIARTTNRLLQTYMLNGIRKAGNFSPMFPIQYGGCYDLGLVDMGNGWQSVGVTYC